MGSNVAIERLCQWNCYEIIRTWATGAVNNGSSYVSSHVLTVFTVLELNISKQRMLFPKIFISVQKAKEWNVRKSIANKWYTFSWARCTHLIILVVANEGILFNKCSKMLFLKKKYILSNLFVKQKQYKPSSWRHFVFATSFWFLLPLTTLVAPNGMIAPYKTNDLGQFKEKSRKKKFLKIFSLWCMTCHWS